MAFCRNCGDHHAPEVECPFIWMECDHCKEHHKTAPDMPMVVHEGMPTGVFCGTCGKDDGWKFYPQEHFKD